MREAKAASGGSHAANVARATLPATTSPMAFNCSCCIFSLDRLYKLWFSSAMKLILWIAEWFVALAFIGWLNWPLWVFVIIGLLLLVISLTDRPAVSGRRLSQP